MTAEAAAIEYSPSDCTHAIDLRELFSTKAPLELDLGCGDGSFIAAMATAYPERNFIGVERLLGRVRSACRQIAARRLTNARILRVEIAQAVTCLIPAASIQVCHVMFPDPWPKRRHHRRRTITTEFLQATSRILLRSGLLRLTTDDAAYFEQMQRAAADVPELVRVSDDDGAVAFPQSTFQKRFDGRGLTIHRLVLRKVSADR